MSKIVPSLLMDTIRNNYSHVDINVKDDEQECTSGSISDDNVEIKEEKMIVNEDSFSCDQFNDTEDRVYKTNLIKTAECISKENTVDYNQMKDNTIIKDEIKCTSEGMIDNGELKDEKLITNTSSDFSDDESDEGKNNLFKATVTGIIDGEMSDDDIQTENKNLIVKPNSDLSNDGSDKSKMNVFEATITGKDEDGIEYFINIEEDISGNCLSIEELCDIREQLIEVPIEIVQCDPPKREKKKLSAVFLDMIWKITDKPEEKLRCGKCDAIMRKSILNFHQKTDSCEINAFLLYIKKSKNLKNTIPCKFCTKQFLGNRMLEHIKSKKCTKSLLSVKNIFQNKIRTKLKKMYSCTYCDLEYPSVLVLYAHLKKEHQDFNRLLPCNLCNFATYNLRPLYVHMFVEHHDDRGRYKCSYCDCTDANRDEMIVHMNEKHTDEEKVESTNSDQAIATTSDMELPSETSEIERKRLHKSNKTFLSEIDTKSQSKSYKSKKKRTLECEETVMSAESLLEHTESLNQKKITLKSVEALLAEAQMAPVFQSGPSKSEVICEKCDKSFLTERLMSLNYCERCLDSLDCTKRNWYSCTYCSVNVPYALGLHLHIKQKHSDLRMELRCKDCKFRTNKLRLLYTHMNIEHGSCEGRLRCQHCDYVEFCGNLMNRHKREKHSNLWLTKCATCRQVFQGNPQFQKHLIGCGQQVVKQDKLIHAEEIYLCDICGKVIKKSSFKSHRRAHVTVKEFKCKHCTKKFRTSSQLDEHSLIHDEGGKYKCIDCDEIFNTKRNHEMHIHVVHKNRKLYCCTKCDMKYCHKHRYETHLREVHTDHFRFDCKVCGKKFKRSMHVKQHMVVHTKEQPFGCELCEMRYTQAHALRAHMRAKHKNS